jgi:hypothetical protein
VNLDEYENLIVVERVVLVNVKVGVLFALHLEKSSLLFFTEFIDLSRTDRIVM